MTSVAAVGQQTHQSGPTVTIYVRNFSKKAIMLMLPTTIKLQQLKENIFQKMRVPHEDQVLFLHGSLVAEDDDQLQLRNKLIFHLVNLKRTTLQTISIFVKRIEPNSPSHKFVVSPSTKISEFMATSFQQIYGDMDNYFLVYTGRQLQNFNTFALEYVEDQSEILAIHKVENLKKQFPQPSPVNNPSTQQKKLSINDENKNEVKRDESLEQVNRSQEESKSNPAEEQQQSYTEDIIIDSQQKYSVISKDNLGPQNVNVKKKLRSNFYSRPNRRESNPREEDEEEEEHHKQQAHQQEHLLGEHYHSSKSDLHDKSGGYPLGLTVISSRHDEEQSLNEEMYRAGKNSSSGLKQEKHSEEVVEQKSVEDDSKNEESVPNYRKKSSEANAQEKKEVESEKKEEQNILELTDPQGQYGRTNIMDYIEELQMETPVFYQDEAVDIKDLRKSRTEDQPVQIQNVFNPHIQENQQVQKTSPTEIQLDYSQSVFSKKDEPAQEGSIRTKKKTGSARSKSIKSNNSDSLLLETSQDANDDNLFSGKFAWGSLKNDKGAIDLSSQLQEQENFMESIPEANTKNWHQLSFSFRNTQALELKAGDLMMLGNESSLKVETLQEDLLTQFCSKLGSEGSATF